MCIFVVFSDREYELSSWLFSTFTFGLLGSYTINDQLSPLGTYLQFHFCL